MSHAGSAGAPAVTFQHVRLSGHKGGEEARLVFFNGLLAAVLVRLADVPREQQGWCPEIGFPPHNRGGPVFRALDEAVVGARARLATGRIRRWAPGSP